jgi:uncharacterized protein DUF4166
MSDSDQYVFPHYCALEATRTQGRFHSFNASQPDMKAPSKLYQKLLGASWPDLDVALRRLHDSVETVRAVGRFRVRRGSNWLARTMARLARLPAEGEAVDVRLQVTAQEECEVWLRTFAGRPLVSIQYDRGAGLLVERFGLMEMLLRLEVGGGALSYQTAGAALRIGPLRISLPCRLSPYVVAWEKAVGDTNQIHVSVDVILPLLGRLIAYDGILTQVEAQQ